MMGVRQVPFALLGVLLLGCFGRSDVATAQPPGLQEFAERVRKYMELHQRLERQLPPLRKTENPAEITARRQAFAAAIRAARQSAAAGDIFGPAVPDFRRIIDADVKQTGTVLVSSAAPEKPVVPLRVNGDYPSDEPLSSVPPLLLKRLPPLPEELEYRFVGQHLLLLDNQANLIADVLPDAGAANH